MKQALSGLLFILLNKLIAPPVSFGLFPLVKLLLLKHNLIKRENYEI